MKKVDTLAGISIDEACIEVYDRALHGGSLYFDFNGIRISMYPKRNLEDRLNEWGT